MLIKRNVLLNPGPATTTDSVKLAQVVPDICPREKEFKDILNQLRMDLLGTVHASQSKYTCVLFCGSGTINMDICLNSLLPSNKKVLVINNGAYSSRAVEICSYYGLPYIDLKSSFFEQPNLDDVKKILEEHKDIAVVYSTFHETGTGILNPIREIGKLAHKYGAKHIVDTTSALGMIPINIEEDHIDFCMASAQKGIQGMAGLSFVIGDREEIKRSKNYPKRSYYCNLFRQYDYFEKNGEMHFTPPVQVVYAAVQALKEYYNEGEQAKWERHQRIADAIHKGLAELGYKEVIDHKIQSSLVVSVFYPNNKNWNFEKVHNYCFERGFTIYPGKITTNDTFRICTLGAINEEDIFMFMKVLKDATNNI